jgi:hypothetical protein
VDKGAVSIKNECQKGAQEERAKENLKGQAPMKERSPSCTHARAREIKAFKMGVCALGTNTPQSKHLAA